MPSRRPSSVARSVLVGFAAALALAPAAHAASFNCAKAKTPDERAVCFDPVLSNLDSRLVGLLDLDEATVAMGQRGALQDQQSAWLKTRAACVANRACLLDRYQSRLKQVTDRLTSRLCGKNGPPC